MKTIALLFLLVSTGLLNGEPPALSSPLSRRESDAREDTIPGYIEMSNGEVFPGLLYITRDKRLEIYDVGLKRQRTVPIQKIAEIECSVEKEWMEKEWRFKELASDEKMYTGRTYPCRMFTYTLIFDDGRKLEGPMSGIIFVQPLKKNEDLSVGHIPERDAQRFYFHARLAEKTDAGKQLADIHYTARVKIGDDALQEGIEKAKAFGNKKNAKTPPAKIKQRTANEKRAKI
ncbi:MAG: hypothetical protein LBN39_07965 [Planctomycetaceae bacterium]|jgi:hypothetical protein|nr:hypothetical protein [Planctomycetaceae bacterium]